MAAHISPSPTPVASQLLTPQKSAVTHAEPQKNTFKSELSDANNRAQESGKSANSVQKSQENVEKSNNESFTKSEDRSVDDNLNSSSVSAADTNAVRSEQQQKRYNDSLQGAEITQRDTAKVDNSVSFTSIDKGQELPDAGGKLPPPSLNAQFDGAALSPDNVLATTDVDQKAAVPATQNSPLNIVIEQPRGQAGQTQQVIDTAAMITASAVAATANSAVGIDSESVLTDKIAAGVTTSEVNNVNTAEPVNPNSVVNTALATSDQNLKPSNSASLLAQAVESNSGIAKVAVNESPAVANQLSGQQGKIEKTLISQEISASNAASNQSALSSVGVAQTPVLQETVNTPIDGAKPSAQSQLNTAGLVGSQVSDPVSPQVGSESVAGNITDSVSGVEKNQLNSQNINSLTATSETLVADNVTAIARDSAITAAPQAVSQMASTLNDKLSSVQANNSDVRLASEKVSMLGDSEQTLLSESAKKTIINDTRAQGNQPIAPLPTLPAGPTSLTDNQTLALNQSLEKMRSGIDVSALNKQADDATVKNSVDKALVANEAVQQLSHLHNNLKTASPVQLQMPVATPPTAKNWGNAVAEKVMIAASQNLRVANIQLDPPELGALQVRLQVTGPDQQMSVSFTSPHASVRDALEQNLPRLREMLEQQGINLGESSVNDQGKGDSNGAANGQHSSLYAEQDEGATINPLNTQGSLALVDFYA
ncbi:flagellar hook-length control protein FliK [Gammaproteobacteria bacterium AS21]